MRTEYRQIEVDLGMELDEVIHLLQKHNANGEKVCVDFNGHILYSDIDEDEIYKQITGRTKLEYIALVANEEKRLVDKFKTQ